MKHPVKDDFMVNYINYSGKHKIVISEDDLRLNKLELNSRFFIPQCYGLNCRLARRSELRC